MCQAEGAHLADIRDYFENSALFVLASEVEHVDDTMVWIGLNDIQVRYK